MFRCMVRVLEDQKDCEYRNFFVDETLLQKALDVSVLGKQRPSPTGHGGLRMDKEKLTDPQRWNGLMMRPTR